MTGVEYTLDSEYGIDPTDPLGDLAITDDRGCSLLLSETFIDVWMLSLMKAIFSICNSESLNVEVLEEPYLILMTENNGFLDLECEGMAIHLESGQARQCFIDAAKNLVDELSKYDGSERNIAIEDLKRLVIGLERGRRD